MRIAVVDDDIRVYEHLKACFGELLGTAAKLSYYASGEDFLSVWQPDAFDLIVLDIFMGKLTGMDVARKIRKTDRAVKIAFGTSSNEYASESYEVNACYYLHKPFGKERVKAMLDRLNLAEVERMRTARLPDGTSILLRSILYADCVSHSITLHCKGGRSVSVRANFFEIENLLCAYPYFFSPTKGMVINFYEVSAQGRDTFTMSDGKLVPISRRKAKEVRDAYSSFLFERLRNGGDA